MSATLATKLYQAYFNLPDDQKILHVGVRTYPIQELYLEDLNRLKLSSKEKQAVAALTKECEAKKCTTAPAQHAMKHLHTLAARLALLVADPGCAVLIFVPGMAEIIAITEAIEGIYVVGVRYTCFPIHSDIPFEDQLAAFDAPEANEVKIIIATPAAESSVTLPAVDHCIDLGLCRQIVYNVASHRQTLTPTWISRASAKQRAGRTGRVRPGTVYRLYTKKAYVQYMDEFEPGEMVRIPLDSVILMLKEMLDEKVTPVLLGCLEPPNTSSIDRSFESLHQWNFIESPTDDGKITVLGSFVTSLGMDLRFGSLIGLGIQFGVAAEAVELASVMSFPKSPFQITSPLIHSPAEYNEIASITFMSRCHFDANLYSEPLGLMNLMWDYEKAQHKGGFCLKFRVAINRFRQLVSSKNNKRKRVAEFLGIDEERLKMEAPPVHMHPSKVAILRTLQAWVFSDMIIEAKPVPIKQTSDGAVMLNVSTNGRMLSSEDLLQVLDKDRHPHRIHVSQRIKQNGSFVPVMQPFEFRSFLPVFEERLVSYICVKEIDLAWFVDSDHLIIYIPERLTTEYEFMALLDVVVEGETWIDILAEEETNAKRRGISERTCGAWVLKDSSHYIGTNKGGQQKRYRRYEMAFHRSLKHILGEVALGSILVRSSLEWNFSEQSQHGKKKKKKEKKKKEIGIPVFSVTLNGSCSDINKMDLQDLLGTSAVSFSVSRNTSTQTLVFDPAPNRPFTFKSPEDTHMATCSVTEGSSWKNPMFVDIPEGARLLSVIASGQRRLGQKIILQSKEIAREGMANGESEEAKLGEFDLLLGKETSISHRWKRLSGGGSVYVPEFSLPASATSPAHHLFACCANALEVAGGGLRVDCLSLLPPDPLLVAVSFLSFGLQVPGAHLSTKCSVTDATENGITAADANALLDMSYLLRWIRARYHCDAAHADDENLLKYDERIAMTKVTQAVSFHRSTAMLGEALVCLPSSVKDLCNLLDGLGGQKVALWGNLPEKALTNENLSRWRKEKRVSLSQKLNQPIPLGKDLLDTLKTETGSAAPEQSEAKIDDEEELKESSEVMASCTKQKKHGVKKGNKGEKISPKKPAILGLVPTSIPTTKKQAPSACQLSHDVAKEYQDLFATKLPDGGKVALDELASTNILALLMEECGSILMDQKRAPKRKKGWSQWKVYKLNQADGVALYRACFSSTLLPWLPIDGRGKNLLPKWMKRMTRPIQKEDVPPCIPDATRKACLEAHQVQSAGKMDVWFHSIDAALRMEAAFWLERQFCRASRRSDRTATFRHWYNHTFEEMMAIALET
jgi:Helicase conserved C-terminal domain